MAAMSAYGSSWTSGRNGAAAEAYAITMATPDLRCLCTYTIHCSNPRSLIHWSTPVIEPPHSGNYVRFFFLFFFFSFFLFRALPKAYGSSQAELNWSQSCQPTPQPQQSGDWRHICDLHVAHSNTLSLTHWARLGIKLASSWILVGFIPAVPGQELPMSGGYSTEP